MSSIFDNRKSIRLNTHIVLEMVFPGSGLQHYGYIENLCEGGMGVISLDAFRVGTQVYTTFDIPDSGERICPKASVLHSRVSEDSKGGSLPYIGFRFDSLNDRERASIRRYIQGNLACAQ